VNDEYDVPHASVLSSCSPDIRQSGVFGVLGSEVASIASLWRRSAVAPTKTSKLAGRSGDTRGAVGVSMALTRIFAGQQKSGAAGNLILRLRVCVCMSPPWRQAAEMNRERNPESKAAGSLDELSGKCLTIPKPH
jgi:hypothetical protein